MTSSLATETNRLHELLLSRPLSRAVDETSELLKRWYILDRGSMRALAGWIPAIATQEIKIAAARHLWLDALSADELRTRILQLRYPRRDVERKWDDGLTALIRSATNAPDDLCFIAGLYRVVKPAQLEAYRNGLTRSEPVGDSPTRWLTEQLVASKAREIEEMHPLLDAAEQRSPTNRDRREKWTQYLTAVLRSCGGVSGEGAKIERPSDTSLERPFSHPIRSARDPRYQHRCELATHHPILWVEDSPEMTWLSHAVGHFSEMWAIEASAVLLYDHPDTPWELQLDGARWAHDEARHSNMGITRLQRAGLDLFKDVPAQESVTYDCYEPDHLKERILSIHAFERGGITEHGKQHAAKWHHEHGDGEGANHFDFDWADESIHLQYGLEWIKHLYGEEILDKNFDQRLIDAVAYRATFLQELAQKEKTTLDETYQRMCDKLNIPFKVKPADHPWKGRE